MSYDVEMDAIAFFARRRTAPMGDRGTVINIVSWLLAVVVICVLTARFTMRFMLKGRTRRLGLEDLFIFMAFVSRPAVFATAQG